MYTGKSSENIYVAAVEGAQGKERNGVKLSLPPPKLMVF
jgi:hypothetical protein